MREMPLLGKANINKLILALKYMAQKLTKILPPFMKFDKQTKPCEIKARVVLVFKPKLPLVTTCKMGYF